MGEDELLHPAEVGFMKQFFTMLANLHLHNKQMYEKIRLFILSPYDSTVSQMSEPNLIKSGYSSNVMRDSVKRITLLHRGCVPRGEICKHLRYLLARVWGFTAASGDK